MESRGPGGGNPLGMGMGSNPGDLMVQFGLSSVLEDMRKRKMRTSFANYVADVAGDIIPIKPRCPAGSLMEIAMMPVNEDERRLELFDERVLRNALTLQESSEKPKLPDWLNEEQALPADERRKKRRDRKKKKKRKKRRRDGTDGGDGEERNLDDDERRLRKQRKKKRDSERRS